MTFRRADQIRNSRGRLGMGWRPRNMRGGMGFEEGGHILGDIVGGLKGREKRGVWDDWKWSVRKGIV